MSSLTSLYNIPSDDPSFDEWAFNHAAHHYDIVRRIYEVYKIAVPQYILYPSVRQEFPEYLHQIMHEDMDSVLNISGNNLLGINWQDSGELSVWLGLNASEHIQASDILKV